MRSPSFTRRSYAVLASLSRSYSPQKGRSSTCYSPVRHYLPEGRPFDLHVLGTPPAFVLSQDQTLQTEIWGSSHHILHITYELPFIIGLKELTFFLDLLLCSFFTCATQPVAVRLGLLPCGLRLVVYGFGFLPRLVAMVSLHSSVVKVLR